jgi:hypothetical protein
VTARGSNLEPFDAHALVAYYVDKHGAKFESQSGSHQFWRTASGVRVGAAVGAGNKVTTPHMKATARLLGMTYAQLRQDIGHPLTTAGKPKAKAAKQAPPPKGRSATAREMAEVASTARRIEMELRSGAPRDPAFYKPIADAAARALAALKAVAS